MDTTLHDSTVEQTRQVAEWIEGCDPCAAVPTCPAWTLTDLVGHIGSTQRWVSRLVAESVADPSAAFALGWDQPPTKSSQWPEWLVAGALGLRSTFAAADDGRTVFDPSGGGDGVAFWSTRTFGEIAVHRIDAARTLDETYEIEVPLAVRAIEDWIGTIASNGWAANVPGFADAMRGNGETIALVADDADHCWLLRRTGADAPLVLAHERGDADVTIHGPARELLEIVSRRRQLDQSADCTIIGNRNELIHLIDNMNWVGAA